VTAVPAVIVPMVQVPELYTPRLGVADTRVSPAGRRSWTVTPVAVSGPPLVRVIVNRTVSPTAGLELLES